MTLLTHSSHPGLVRHETLNGIEYLVAPVVALREGVVNNHFVDAIELEKSVQSWQGRPVTVPHPVKNGELVSANSPEVDSFHTIGKFFNVMFEDNALKGEIWLNIARCQELGGEAERVMTSLESEQHIEVSTGYFANFVPVENGTENFQGESYTAYQRDISPDHLAILANEEGACSWKDGCGVPRVNHKEIAEVEDIPLDNDLEPEPVPVLNKDEACGCDSAPTDTPHRVTNSTEDDLMEKTEIIRDLVANGGAGFSEEELETLEVPVLTKMHTALTVKPEPVEVPQPEPQPDPEPPAPVTNAENSDLAEVASLIKELGGTGVVKAAFSELVSNREREKETIIASLTANERVQFTANELRELGVEHLRKLEQTLQPVNYQGNSGSPVTNQSALNGAEMFEALAMPEIGTGGEA